MPLVRIVIFACALLCACATAESRRPLAGPALRGSEPTGPSGSGSLSSLPLPVLIERGNACLVAGSYPMAELHFAQALKTEPGSQEALLGLGESLLRQGKYPAALANFERARSTNQDSVPALLGLGRTALALGDAKGAVPHLLRAQELAPGNPDVLTELALAYEATGKEPLAEPLLARVTELRPDSAAAHNNRGFNYILQKRFQEALTPLERAHALAPGDRLVLNNLALACAMTGQDDRAFQLFERSVGNAGAYNNLGYVHMTKGDWQKAEQAFSRALEADPKYYARAKQNLDDLAQLILQGAKKDVEALKIGPPTAEARP